MTEANIDEPKGSSQQSDRQSLEEDSKYEQLQDVYNDLIEDYEDAKDSGKKDLDGTFSKGEASGLLIAIQEVEDLLNEWESDE